MGIAYNTSIVRDGLVLHLDAANPKSYPGSGTTWFDLSGNGNNGTLLNGVGYSGDNNGSLTFDGVNDYVTFGAGSAWAFGSNGTVDQWVYPTNSTGNDRLWCVTNNTSSLDAYLNGTTYNLYFHGGQAYGGTLIPNVWNFVCVTYNNGTIQTYINGVAAQMGGNATGYNITNTNTFYLARYASTGYELYGRISSFKIYNRALTASEIQQNFEALRGRYGI